MARKYRKVIGCYVTLSIAADVSAFDARRELRTRVNELCCFHHDEDAVRVKSIKASGVRIKPYIRRNGPRKGSK